jgi:hypothetical protein
MRRRSGRRELVLRILNFRVRRLVRNPVRVLLCFERPVGNDGPDLGTGNLADDNVHMPEVVGEAGLAAGDEEAAPG